MIGLGSNLDDQLGEKKKLFQSLKAQKREQNLKLLQLTILSTTQILLGLSNLKIWKRKIIKIFTQSRLNPNQSDNPGALFLLPSQPQPFVTPIASTCKSQEGWTFFFTNNLTKTKFSFQAVHVAPVGHRRCKRLWESWGRNCWCLGWC